MRWPVFVLTFVGLAQATTEWFGDNRAHLNPPSNLAPFYDVHYDDVDCPEGIQSNAVPEYAYFGQMVAARLVSSNLECAQYCLANSKCKSVNFFQTDKDDGKAYCELLYEDQRENPLLMRPFKKSVYYEKIQCKPTTDADVEELVPEEVTKEPQTETILDKIDLKAKTVKQELEMLLSLKKLSKKVHEFNMKFRS
ncbi:PAN-1 domain and Apple-like domain-containing protein [Aphelenchoides bicaudatus]|nr:PAN-1 domain and Apple-like domain-containing protein [Aphelenchoides bicaudatus]